MPTRLRDDAWDLVPLVVPDLPFGAYYDVARVIAPPTPIPPTPLPLPDAAVRRFAIASSLADPVDSFDLDLASLELFLDPNPARRLALSVGLLQGDTELLVGQLRQGQIFDMRLAANAAGVQVSVRGLDAMAAMVQRYINRQYVLHSPTTSPVPGSSGPTGRTPYVPPPPEIVVAPNVSAKRIAADLAKKAGLTLQWNCRDYILKEDFAATGRLIDVLMRLLEPWNLVAPSKVDVYTRGSVLVVQQRPRTPAAEYVTTVAASRVTDLTIDRVELDTVGDLLLFGEQVSQHLTSSAPGGVMSGTTLELFRVDVARPPDEPELQHIVESRELYRMPDRILLESTKDLYAVSAEGGPMAWLTETIMKADYDASIYGPTGPVNQPLQRGSLTETYAIQPGRNGKHILAMRETLTLVYDANRFLRTATTFREVHPEAEEGDDLTGVTTVAALIPLELEMVTYEDAVYNQVLQTTYKYVYGENGEMILDQKHQQYNAGLRVGGTRPPGSGVDTGQGQLAPIWAHQVVSTAPYARAVQYSNPHLTAADLEFIRQNLVAASGLYEYRLTFSGPAMPWLRKGMWLHLTDFSGPDGQDIPLQPALITDLRLTYDAGDRPGSRADVTAVFWKAT